MQSSCVYCEFRPIVVAPSYNNSGTVAGVLARLAELGLPILLVNDGSTDSTAELLASWQGENPSGQVQVLTHRRNRGKAAALRTGFAAAIQAGYTHAVTIDTDGQHDPAYIPALLDLARRSPESLVLGVRDDTHPDYPSRSRVGRRLSNLFIRLECGLRVADSQCGLRVYPLELIRTVKCRAGRFEYESEIISRAGWAGCPVLELPVNTTYLPPGRRVSHYRPWMDSIRGVLMHVRLVLRAVVPLPHRRYRPRGVLLRRWLAPRELLSWLDPRRAWRELRDRRTDRTELAAALSVGVFVGNLPAYPFQTLLAIYLARRLHLNPLAVVAGSQVSTPPVGLLLIAAAIYVGHFLLHGSAGWIPDFHSAHFVWRSVAGPLLLDWVVGGTAIGILMGAIVFGLSLWLFRGGAARAQLPASRPERRLRGARIETERVPSTPRRTSERAQALSARPDGPAPGRGREGRGPAAAVPGR